MSFLPSTYKQLSRQDLESIFQSISFRTKPYLHQLAFLAWASSHSRVMCWLDVGTGKSLCALYLAALWKCSRLFIVCPNSVLSSWAEQISLHTTFSYEILKGSTLERQKKLQQSISDVLLINYEGLKHLFGKKIITEHGRGKYVVDWQKRLPKNINCLIFDELHHLKTPNAISSKIALSLSKSAPHIIGLTGTPIKDLQDLFSQYLILDLGKTLGTHFYSFLNQWFNKGQYQWYPKSGAREELLSRIEPITMRYARSECIELPGRVDESRIVNPSKEQKELLKKAIDGLIALQQEKKLSAFVIKNRLLDLTRIAGGFYKNAIGDIRHLRKNPKLDALVSFLCFEASENQQVVIFAHFVEENRLIERRLKKEGFSVSCLRGEITDKAENIEDFTSNKTQILVANPRCGGEGLNLHNASTCVFYSFAYEGAVSREQAEGRIFRAGQTKCCLFIDLLMDEPFLDKQILASVKKGQRFSDRVLEQIEKGLSFSI